MSAPDELVNGVKRCESSRGLRYDLIPTEAFCIIREALAYTQDEPYECRLERVWALLINMGSNYNRKNIYTAYTELALYIEVLDGGDAKAIVNRESIPYGVPLKAMTRISAALYEGAKHYGDHNWEKGIPINNCLDHCMGHLIKYANGDTKEDHLGHALTNLMFASVMICRNGNAKQDERRLVYIAQPIDYYTGDKKKIKEELVGYLTSAGMTCYMPADAFAANNVAKSKEIIKINTTAIDNADVVVALLPTGCPTVGTIREIEYAKSRGKRVVVMTDMPVGVYLTDVIVTDNVRAAAEEAWSL